MQLHQVVAGDVLHHPAAGAGDLTGWVGDGDADHPVPDGAVAGAAEPVGVAGQHPTDRRSSRVWWVKREALTLCPQRRLEVVDRHPGFDPARQVGGLILQETAHRLGRERDVVPSRRRPQWHLRAAAPDDNRGLRQVAKSKSAGRVLGVDRSHHR